MGSLQGLPAGGTQAGFRCLCSRPLCEQHCLGGTSKLWMASRCSKYWEWQRPRGSPPAVSSGSSFPRNPLGTLRGIPGNTVLEAMAQQLEKTCPLALQRPPEVRGAGAQGMKPSRGFTSGNSRPRGREDGAHQHFHGHAGCGEGRG